MTIDISRLHELFDYDQNTGKLIRKKSARRDFVGGATHHKQCLADGQQLRTTHVIWALVYGYYPLVLIDHKDGDQKNNRLSNLREATDAQNQQNKLYKGEYSSCVVEKKDATRKKPFAVRVRFNGMRIHGGHYSTREEAEQVAKKIKLKAHGEFAAERR